MDLTPEQEAALDGLLQRAPPSPEWALGIYWWPSDDGRRVLVRQGQLGYRVPLDVLDAPDESRSLADFEVDFPAVQRALDVLSDAVLGEVDAAAAEAAVAGADAEASELEADFGPEFGSSARAREAVEELGKAVALLKEGDRKGVLDRTLGAQAALMS